MSLEFPWNSEISIFLALNEGNREGFDLLHKPFDLKHN